MSHEAAAQAHDHDGEEGLFAYLGEFADKASLLAAIASLRQEGFSRWDAYSPYPLPEFGAYSGEKEPNVGAWTLAGGLGGFGTGYLMQWYAATISSPILVGGKPLNSVPAFMVICFELTILGAALCTLFGLFLRLKLPTYYHPLFNVEAFTKASRDGFFLCVEATDPLFALGGTAAWLSSVGATNVFPVPN